MASDHRKYLYDIAGAGAAIRGFCRGRTLADYEASHLLRSACERQLEILGEALTRLRDRHADVYLEIPEGNRIIGFRNRLIHGYDTVDSVIVWEIIQTKLPGLMESVDRSLVRTDSETGLPGQQ